MTSPKPVFMRASMRFIEIASFIVDGTLGFLGLPACLRQNPIFFRKKEAI
jgi:hypothetical protein